MSYYDAHCHLLDINEFELAGQTGVKNCIVNATEQQEWAPILALPNVIHAIGIHPWKIKSSQETWLTDLEKLLEQNPTAHIGEIGLDKCKNNFYDQIDFFHHQLDLAQKLNRPVHIHIVRAWNEAIELFNQYPTLTYLFHRFSGDKNTVRFFENKNAYFSVNSATKIPIIPADKLLIESDAPSGLPSPTNIPCLYQQLGVNEQQIEQNFERFIHGR